MKDDCMGKSLGEASPGAAAEGSCLPAFLSVFPQKEERSTQSPRSKQSKMQNFSRARARNTEGESYLFQLSLCDLMRKREGKQPV